MTQSADEWTIGPRRLHYCMLRSSHEVLDVKGSNEVFTSIIHDEVA